MTFATASPPVESAARNVRRPIALKIFGISVLLLAMMIVVTILSTISLRRVGAQMNLLADYYIALEQKIGDIRALANWEVTLLERVLQAKSVVDDGQDVRSVALLKDAGNCEGHSLQPLLHRIRAEYPEKAQQQWMTYRAIVRCTDSRIESATSLVVDAIGRLQGQPEQLTRFVGFKSELDNIPPARGKLSEGVRRFLALDGKTSSSDNDASFQERVDERRQEVNQRIRRVAKSLNEGTRESAELTRSLVSQAQWLSWSITSAACVLGLLVAYLLTRSLVRPLRKLLRFTRQIRAGNLDADVNIRTADEIALLADSFNHMVGELRQKEAIKAMFGKYVDPKIVHSLMADCERFEHGERQTMSVFFSDIENYTAICEGLAPAVAVRVLNNYFALMADPIRANSGIIDKYIGDSIMAYWGPPFCTSAEHARLACLAALEQQALMPTLQAMLPDVLGIRRNVPELRVRMAIASGDVTLGSIGSADVRSYTVIGDNVNFASRLEGANKIYRTRILISELTAQLAADAVEVREIDAIRVMGKLESVRIFELLGRKGQIESHVADLRLKFEVALEAYRGQRWDEAVDAFSRCLEIDPGDGPSQVLLARVSLLRAQALPGQWDGVWVLDVK